MKIREVLRKKFVLIIIGILFLVFCFSGFILFERNSIDKLIIKDVVKPYGETVSINDFLKEDINGVSTDADLDGIKDIGSYEIKIKVWYFEYTVNLKIYDSVINKIVLRDLTIYIDEDLPTISDFIVSDIDLSLYKHDELSIKKELGTQDVLIKIYDEYDNVFSGVSKLNIIEDEDAPVFTGLTNITIEAGNKYDLYKNVEAVDGRFGKVSFTVDDSRVKYDTPGEYKIIYSAEDGVGNKVIDERIIIIIEKDITYKIDNFPTFYQYPDYPNGCESAALYNLLRFYKVNITMSQIVNDLKKGDGPYSENGLYYGGNPNIEFIGDPRDSRGYGVYQKPIINVANKYKSGMIDYTGYSFDDVLKIVKKGIPVQIWASVGMQNTKVCASWIYKETGEKINWICKLHSVVVIGYNKNSVFVSDSYTGRIESYSRKQVEKIFNLFGKRAIYYAS